MADGAHEIEQQMRRAKQEGAHGEEGNQQDLDLAQHFKVCLFMDGFDPESSSCSTLPPQSAKSKLVHLP